MRAATSSARSTGAMPRRTHRGCVAAAGLLAVAVLLLGCLFWTYDDIWVERLEPLQAEYDSEAIPNAAQRGEVPWSSLGPRPPGNDLERRRAAIPEYRPEQDLVVYSHIHKTSGTSISALLANVFTRTAVVPTSHPSKQTKVEELQGHDEAWWQPYQVMFSHDRPNITDTIGIPASKTPKMLFVIRNPLLHKASIFFESVCRFGQHIKNGTIDQEEAAVSRATKTNDEKYNFCRDPELWVGSEMFRRIYQNFEANWLSYGAAARHECLTADLRANLWKTGRRDEDGTCDALKAQGGDAAVWEEYYRRTAEAGIRRMEGALWVGVTERMEESTCLLFYTLGKKEREVPQYRRKTPRPISVWSEEAISKAAKYDWADWRVFDAANDILDLRLWEARERLKDAGEEQREKIGSHCFDLLTGGNPER